MTAVLPVAQQSASLPSITYLKGIFAVKAMIAPASERTNQPRGIEHSKPG